MKKTILASLVLALAVILNFIKPQMSIAQNLNTEIINLGGSVSYLQKIALPQNASLIVQLVDISNADGSFPVVAETAFQPTTEVPINFTLAINPKTINTNKNYALQAKIVVGDMLWFVGDDRIAVNFNDSDARYTINLVPLNQNNNQPTMPTSIIGQEWLVEDIFAGGIIDSSHMTILIDAKAEPTKTQNVKKYHVTGSGGCNRYNTSVLIDETKQTLDFTPPTMTFMVCAQAITQQEGRFIEMMGRANDYIFDDLGRLILKDEQGNYIGRLVPNL